MVRLSVVFSVLSLAVASIACSNGAGGVSCGGEDHPSCRSLTVTASRNAAWDQYCETQTGCTDASEGLLVLLGPNSAANYPEYDPDHLACSEVTFTLEGGGSEAHHFLVLNGDTRETFEIIQEVDVDTCLNLEG